MKQWKALSAAIVLAIGSVSFGAPLVSSTGVYDSTSNANVVDLTAASSSMTFAAFTATVASAWASNSGGVINFDTGLSSTATADFSANYGISGTNSITVTNTGGGTMWNQANASDSTAISGAAITGYPNGTFLGGSSTGTHYFNFSVPLSQFGITVLGRNAARTVTPTIYLTDIGGANPTTVSPGAFTVANNGNSGPFVYDTFFGYIAPGGKQINRVDIVGDGFIRQDDLGFVTVPEPATASLIGLGGLALLRRKR